ncbi:unnamed protein product [Clonostachys rhizophaga]|uniref:Uncharacterized protein n=1 Tax=Clonostachys rhizophaga TaxID=160324 RepID=A0A9N9V006_9HYPO|nr:unnamed protein product [Clonostachys rhizophaga]
MSDAELDRDWKPNGRRPQSTIARSFSAELMDIFRIENDISDLDKEVDQRKQKVGKSNDELASLEARLKEMENRLRRTQHHVRQSISHPPGGMSSKVPDFASKNETEQSSPAADGSKNRSRPGTARAAQPAPGSGNMPPTPGASEGEYYLVTQEDLDDTRR